MKCNKTKHDITKCNEQNQEYLWYYMINDYYIRKDNNMIAIID